MKTLLFLSASLLLADDAKAPEISMAQQLDYRRAQVNLLTAQAELQATISAMEKICAPRQLVTNAKGDPMCAQIAATESSK